jgi:hypothetical protein
MTDTMTSTDELKRLSKEARLGDLEIVSAGTFSRLVRVYSRKAGVYLTDVIDRDNAALIVAAVNALPELVERVKRLEAAMKRMLLEFDFLVEAGNLPDIRNDMIFDEARAALTKDTQDE